MVRTNAKPPRRPTASERRSDTTSCTSSVRTTQTSVSHQSATPRVTDKDFHTTTLAAAYGIEISGDPEDLEIAGAYGHFDRTDGPPNGATKDQVTKYYHAQQLARPHSHVWLSLNEDDAHAIVHEYNMMMKVEEEEAKFAFYATKTFFTQDVAHTPSLTERRNTTYCKMEWAPKPDEQVLRRPPLLPQQSASQSTEAPLQRKFNFENNPDLTFWLPLQLFNSAYRDNLQSFTYVEPRAEVTAPYFTIEFKKADEVKQAAVNRLAAFAALVLYNRFELRRRRLESFNTRGEGGAAEWNARLIKNIKHYGISFAGDMVSIYLARPILTANKQQTPTRPTGPTGSTWAGCSVTLLHMIKLNGPGKVIMLNQWINEIQHWGLGQYALDFMLDVKGIFYNTKGGKSRVSLTAEEQAELFGSMDGSD